MGEKQVVDELLLRFTHNVPLAFMLPGVPPTDKPVELLLVVVVMKFENGKIAHDTFAGTRASLLGHEYMKIASSHGNAMNVFL